MSIRICAYTNLQKITKISGMLYRFQFIRMVDDEHYWHTLNAAWQQGNGLTILEHDLLAWGIGSLERCPEPWCTRSYSVGNLTIRTGLGCAKFSRELTLNYPNLIAESGSLRDMGSGLQVARDWGSLDSRVAYVLHNDVGLRVHTHLPTLHSHNNK